MHSLPQDRVGVPYVHDDCHNLYRPVNQSDVKALQVYCGWGVGGGCARAWAEPAHLLRFWISCGSCSWTSRRAELNKSCHFLKKFQPETLCIKLEGLKV